MKFLFLIKKTYKKCDLYKIKKWFFVLFTLIMGTFLALNYFQNQEYALKNLETNRTLRIEENFEDLGIYQKYIVKTKECQKKFSCLNSKILIIDSYEHAKNMVTNLNNKVEIDFNEYTYFEQITFLENLNLIIRILFIIFIIILLLLFYLTLIETIKNETEEIFLLKALGYLSKNISLIILSRIFLSVIKTLLIVNSIFLITLLYKITIFDWIIKLTIIEIVVSILMMFSLSFLIKKIYICR